MPYVNNAITMKLKEGATRMDRKSVLEALKHQSVDNIKTIKDYIDCELVEVQPNSHIPFVVLRLDERVDFTELIARIDIVLAITDVKMYEINVWLYNEIGITYRDLVDIDSEILRTKG